MTTSEPWPQPDRSTGSSALQSNHFPPDAESFWNLATFADLQAAQGTTGRVDPDALAIVDLTDD